MTISYTDEQKFALLDTGGGNWGAVINGALTAMDAGREITIEAGENIAQYDAVYIKPVDGKIYKAKADSFSTMSAIGIASNAITSGNQGKVRTLGWINNAGWSFTAGDIIYLDAATAGAVTATAPDKSQIIGTAKTTTKILIIPELPENEAKKWLLALNVGDATNYTQIKIDGEIVQHGTARTKKIFEMNLNKSPAGSTPAGAETTNQEEEGIYGQVFDPITAQSCVWSGFVPLDYDPAQNIVIKCRWCLGQDGDAEATAWRWEARWNEVEVADDTILDAETAVGPNDQNVAAAEPQRKFHTLTLATISGLSPGDFLSVSLTRWAAHANDTCTKEIFVLDKLFTEYTSNKLGEAT